ncbi:MAG: hypothetical protein RL885_25920 [Planctomycetota bacterium]
MAGLTATTLLALFCFAGDDTGTGGFQDQVLEPLGSYRPGRNEVRLDQAARRVEFLFQDQVLFSVDIDSWETTHGILDIDEERFGCEIVTGAGMRYRDSRGQLLSPYSISSSNDGGAPAFDWRLAPRTLELDYVDRIDGVATRRRTTIEVRGISLIVTFESLSDRVQARNNYAGTFVGPAKGLQSPSFIAIPFLQNFPTLHARMPGSSERFFFTRYVDPTQCTGSKLFHMEPEVSGGEIQAYISSEIEPLDNGTISDQSRDVMYVIASRHIHSTYPIYRIPLSPYTSELKSRLNADTWTLFNYLHNAFRTELGSGDAYDAGRVFMARLAELGVLGLTVLYEASWNENTSFHYPKLCSDGPDPFTCYPRSDPSSVGSLRAFIDSVTSRGERMGLGGNLIHMASTSPYFETGPIARESDGSLKREQTAKGEIFYLIRPDAQKQFLRDDGALDRSELWKIKRTFPSLNAFYYDAWGKQIPWRETTREAAAPDSKTLRDSIRGTKETLDRVREIVQGPVFTEGISLSDVFDFSGFVDGYEREFPQGESSLVVPDFEQIIVSNYAAHHGVGYLNRFYGGAPWEPMPKSRFDFHQVRAFTIAFGHVGQLLASGVKFDPNDTTLNWWYYHVVNEYYALQQLQQLYTQPIPVIRYRDPGSGELVPLETAIARGFDLRRSQLAITYDNGLNLRLNFADSPWTIDTGTGYGPDQGRFTLPKHGYVGWVDGPGAPPLLAYSATVSGQRVDYVRSPKYTMMNGYGRYIHLGDIDGTWLKVLWNGKTIEGDPFNGCTIR